MTTDSTAGNEESEMPPVAGATDDGRVYVVTPQAMAVEGPPREEAAEDEEPRSVTELVEQPAKVMRIGNMIRQLLAEVKSAPLDDASRQRLRAIHETSITELKEGLAPELAEELERITLPFSDDTTPSDAELRIAQAQLVGWLEGLSTAFRRPCSPSRWLPGRSSSRCGGRYRQVRCLRRRSRRVGARARAGCTFSRAGRRD